MSAIITFSGAYSLFRPSAANPFAWKIVEIVMRRDGTRATKSDGQNVEVGLIIKDGSNGNMTVITDEEVQLSDIQGWVALGGQVEGYPVFLKMDTTEYETDVPTGIPNRTKQDSSIRKWSEWHDVTHAHLDASDGDKIVQGNSWGTELSGSEINQLILDADVEVIRKADVSSYLS